MQISKLESILLCQKSYHNDEITESPCSCELCFKDVKPIVPPEKQRDTSKKQFNLTQTEALYFFFQKAHGFRGNFFIPDTFFLSEAQLYYTNDLGRLKCKQKQTNADVKKHFDEKRKKFQKLSKCKEVAVLIYKDGSHLLLTETHLNKILLKRKNDPVWNQIKAIALIPPIKECLEYKEFFYKTNEDIQKQMRPVMEKVVEDVDSYDEKVNKDASLKNASMIMSWTKSKFGLHISAKKMIEQAIAYLQIVHKVRVLAARFLYLEDSSGQAYLMEIKNFVATQLFSEEQELAIHDRYKSLDIIGEEDLMKLKVNLDFEREEFLWKLCQQIVKISINERKIELNLKQCKILSEKQLRSIFMRIFPNFSTSDIFQNLNWKNQLGDFMAASKKKISKLIRMDEGISILKRYGIVFYRTF